MRFLLLTFLLAASFVGPSRRDDCSCKKPEKDETTHLGQESIVVTEREPYKSMRGVVREPNGEAMEGVLVEVFDKPKSKSNGQGTSPPKRYRVVACKTGESGKFCFEHIPAGEYELVVSAGVGWNDLHYYIKIKPDDAKAKMGIDLEMRVSY